MWCVNILNIFNVNILTFYTHIIHQFLKKHIFQGEMSEEKQEKENEEVRKPETFPPKSKL